jgi:PAS domain S-box-containing protein
MPPLRAHRDRPDAEAANAALVRARSEVETCAERRAGEAEARFRAIVEASPTPFLVSRLADGTILYANARLEDLVGVPTGSLAGQRTPDFYADPADRQHVLAAVAARGEIRDHELEIRRADGTTRWVSLTVQRLAFEGAPALATALLDVTGRKATERALRERTGELEAVFRALPDLYFRMEADGTILDYRAGRQFGLYVPPDEFLGRRVQDVLPPPVSGQTAAALAEVARTGEPAGFEYVLPLGAERRDFEARILPLDDCPEQVVTVVRDVTERNRAERALRESEASYRGLFDHLSELVYILDLDARFLAVNEAVLRAYGYARDEVVGRTPAMLAAPGTYRAEDFAATFSRALGGEPQRLEWWALRKDGTTFPKDVTLQRSTYFGRDVVIAVARDISERVAAEAELVRQRAYFEAILQGMDAGIAVFDATGRYEYASERSVPDPTLRRWVVGKTLAEYAERRGLPPDVIGPRQRSLEAVLTTRAPHSFEQQAPSADGGRWMLRRLVPVLDEAGTVTRMIGYSVDITDRKRAEGELRLQAALLEAQGEASIDGILVVSADGRILSSNRRFAELWGLPPSVVAAGSDERALAAVLDRIEDPEAFLARVAHLYAHPDETARDEVRLRDGRVLDRYSAPVRSGHGELYGRIWFFRDVTAETRHTADLDAARREAEAARERADRYAAHLEASLADLQRAQNRLVQQEKLAGLGRMAAGIAHEIKNPLNFVTNFAELSVGLVAELQAELAARPDRPAAEALDAAADLLTDLADNARKIAEHGRRADAIVRGMMDHARGSSGRRAAVEVNGLVGDAVRLTSEAWHARAPARAVALTLDLDAEAGPVDGVAEELGRAVANLVANALDAAAAGPADTPLVVVRTRRRGEAVEVAVEDNGPGVAEAVRDRLFEPFVTTKPPGGGNVGLGLSLAREIVVAGHGGALEAADRAGGGAVFTAALPAGAAAARAG